MRTFFISTVLFIFSLQGFSQLKYEKESRVKKGDVPAYSLDFVDSINFSSKVKWYKEIGLNTISFEAKTKSNGQQYSIEFSENGSFEDVEIEIYADEIPSGTFNIISKYLSEENRHYSIEKIQVQHLGNATLVLEFLKHRKKSSCIVTNYEIIISAKVDGSFTLFEYLFSENGEFIQNRQMLLKRAVNLEY